VSPGRIDATVLRRHLFALDSALQALRKHTGRSVEEIRSNTDEAWIVERGLQLCAQNCLDIATHLAAGSGADVPDYASAIDELVRLAVLPDEFARRFRGIAGFRNVLVHGYLAVDPDVLHRLLNERLDDFVEFATLVQAHLDRTEG
jgi:uncharacterized protein YutE (UPF0331/DUF86 family)